MGLGWEIARGVVRLSSGASQATARAAAAAAQNHQLRRGRRAARRGVIAPGDPPPPPGSADHYDYRGVDGDRALRHLRDGEFSLGTLVDPRQGPCWQIGLPAPVLHRHAAVIGPSGAGKTQSILLPWAATAVRSGSSVVLVDVSGDMMDDLAFVRQVDGPFNARVAKWDYTDPARSVSWNWLASLQDDDAVVSVTEALIGRDRDSDPQPYFHQRDRRILRGLIEGIRGTRPRATSSDLLTTLQDQNALKALCGRLSGTGAARRLDDVANMPASDYGRAVSGVVNALEALDHPGVRAVTERAQLDIDDLFARPTLLVVASPLHGSRTSEIVGGLLLSQVIRVLYKRFGTRAGTHAFLILDEAPRLTGRLNLEELLAVSRRARVSVCLGAQDVTQFGGDDERVALLSNCSTYVALPTTSKPSAEYLASRLGERRSSAVSVSFGSAGPSPQQTVSHSLDSGPVLGLREIMDPPWGPRCAVVHSPQVASRPFIVDLERRSGV